MSELGIIEAGTYVYIDDNAKRMFCNVYGNEYTHDKYYNNGYSIDRIDKNLDGYIGKYIIICSQEWSYFKKVGDNE